MGYRSDVILTMKKEKFQEYLKQNSDMVAIETLRCDDIKQKEDWILLYYGSVKWYDNFEVVKAITDFLGSLEDSDYEFHRIGEDDSDYEVLGCGCSPFEVRMTRSLDYTW